MVNILAGSPLQSNKSKSCDFDQNLVHSSFIDFCEIYGNIWL